MHEWMGNAYHEKLNNESSRRLLSLLYGGYDILRLNDGLLTSALHVQVRVVEMDDASSLQEGCSACWWVEAAYLVTSSRALEM
jgi:hypothetical protein